MKVLKGFALGFLSFLLFLSLIVFGITYTVNQTVLNSDYIVKTLNGINFSQLIDETLAESDSSGDIPVDLQDAFIDTLKNMEPVIKERIGIVLSDTFAYLKGQSDAPDLKQTLGRSVMNSAFVEELLQNVDLSNLMSEMFKGDEGSGDGFAQAFTDAFIDTIDNVEPELKQEVVDASDPIFKYLLQETSSIDLRAIIRQTVFSTSLMTEVIDSLDFTTMARDTLSEQIGGQLPQGLELTDAQIDRVVAAMEPYFKNGLKEAVDDIADYLVGAGQSFSVSISFAPAMTDLKVVVKEAYVAALPSELQGATQAQIDQQFETYFADFQSSLATSFDMDSSNFGTELSDMMSEVLADAQKGLTDARNGIEDASQGFGDKLAEARPYVSLLGIAFICSIALMVVLAAGIVLIHRNVKDSCRDLGIVSFIFGLIFFVGILVGKGIAKGLLEALAEDIPQAFQSLPSTMMNYVLSPMQNVGLGCLIVGIILIVLAIIYPRLRPAKTS
ncbi:MAG: hypothetical protein JW856_03650 [Dehalococcoidales bacterium]|nr:hypothetical protein [Dehalococcoidales bacterium]